MKLSTRLGKPGLKIIDLLRLCHGVQVPIRDWGEIPAAELCYGQSNARELRWKDFLLAGTATSIPKLQNQGAALLFVPIKRDRYIIYIFSYRSSTLLKGKTEWDFGVKVVMNSIKPDAIKVLGRNARIKRVQVGGLGTIW